MPADGDPTSVTKTRALTENTPKSMDLSGFKVKRNTFLFILSGKVSILFILKLAKAWLRKSLLGLEYVACTFSKIFHVDLGRVKGPLVGSFLPSGAGGPPGIRASSPGSAAVADRCWCPVSFPRASGGRPPFCCDDRTATLVVMQTHG